MSDKEPSVGEESVSIHGVIDRIEDNDMAVVLLGDEEKDQIDLPLAYLPQDARDGDHLSITIKMDEKSRDSMQERIRKLQEELLNPKKK